MIQIIGGTPEASGQTPSLPRRLGLSEALQAARKKNWDIVLAHSETEVAAAHRVTAREVPNPVGSLSLSKISADSAHGSGTALGNSLLSRSYDTIGTISQLIELGGKRTARKAAAQAEEKLAEARLADVRRQLNSGVTRSYVGVLVAEENARILGESAAALKREAEMAEVRARAGDISTNDQIQIAIVADRFRVDAQRAMTEAGSSRVQLALLLGEKHPTDDLVVTDNLDKLIEGLRTPPRPVAAFPEDRPDIVAAEAAVRFAEATLKLQRSQRVPDPTVSAIYEHEPPDQPHTLGLGVSFPLPLWNRNRGNISAARAMLDQAETNARRVAAQAAADISIARQGFQAAFARQEAYRSQILPRSASVRETVAFAYQKGGASLLDLLSAQRNDNEVRLAAAQATGDAIIARMELDAALNYPNP